MIYLKQQVLSKKLSMTAKRPGPGLPGKKIIFFVDRSLREWYATIMNGISYNMP
jgi:hypothetical protein